MPIGNYTQMSAARAPPTSCLRSTVVIQARIEKRGEKGMMFTRVSWTPRRTMTCAGLAVVLFILIGGSVLAKTPDGMPPSQETVCSGLSGAAFGLCNAYCEAQDCDVHPRPSCPVLRRNFAKITGSPIFPCDQRGCGDGVIQRGEECDPPGSGCPDGRMCRADCTCPEPFCGDGIVDPGEDCDPPGSECDGDIPCGRDCRCITEPVVCCECPAGTAAVCQNDVPLSDCFAQQCIPGAPGTVCNPFGACVPQQTLCCRCPDQCITVGSPDECPTFCEMVAAPSACDDDGNCQMFPVPVP
jgi:hypothetical protein